MGLRCSLLGHDYGDVVVERDRDERGDEVVVTEREVRTCSRCGAETVRSENTEVRRKDRRETGESEADPATPDSVATPESTEASASVDSTVDADAVAADEGAESAAEPAPEAAASAADTDDAIIIDAESDEPVAEGPSDSRRESRDSSEGAAPPEDEATTAGEASTEDPAERSGTAGDGTDDAEFIDDSPTATDSTDESATEGGGIDASAAEEPPTDRDDADATGEPGAGAGSSRSHAEVPDEDAAAPDPSENPGTTVDAPDEGTPPADEPEPTSATDETRPSESPSEQSASAADADTSSSTASPSAEDHRTPSRMAGDDRRSGEESRGEEADATRRNEGSPSAEANEFEFGTAVDGEESSWDVSSGIASAGSIDTTGPVDSNPEGVLTCPACDFAVPVARSSNRAGDICPDCHAGYLTEEH